MTRPGSGPGAITPDGCSVEVYSLLEPRGEADLVRGVVPTGSSLLELGAGVGRVTKRLVAAGYKVTAVDESPEMLARLNATAAERVVAKIEALDLGRTYDAVLLMSHLVNTPDDSLRKEFLLCCRRHLAQHGILVVQRHPPEWFAGAGDLVAMDGPVAVRLRDVTRPTTVTVTATVEYENRGRVWTQTFTSRLLSDEELDIELAVAGLKLDRWLDPERCWFTARLAEGQAAVLTAGTR